MSNRELIAEARKWSYGKVTNQPVAANDIIQRLAAALETMELPEGYRATEYTRPDGICVWEDHHPGTYWWICERKADRRMYVMSKPFPSAREAMAALDGKDG